MPYISAIFNSAGTISEITADFLRKSFHYCVCVLRGVALGTCQFSDKPPETSFLPFHFFFLLKSGSHTPLECGELSRKIAICQ